MPRRTHDDVSWEGPRSPWVDETRPSFVPATAGADVDGGPLLRLWFEPLSPGITIRTLADRALASPTKDLPGLKLVDLDTTTTMEVDGRPAILLRFLLRTQEKLLIQTRDRLVVRTQVWVDAVCEPEPSALVIAATSPTEAALDTQARLEKLLGSVRFGPAPRPDPSKHPVDPWKLPEVPMPRGR
jgi:hypothetical protein